MIFIISESCLSIKSQSNLLLIILSWEGRCFCKMNERIRKSIVIVSHAYTLKLCRIIPSLYFSRRNTRSSILMIYHGMFTQSLIITRLCLIALAWVVRIARHIEETCREYYENITLISVTSVRDVFHVNASDNHTLSIADDCHRPRCSLPIARPWRVR